MRSFNFAGITVDLLLFKRDKSCNFVCIPSSTSSLIKSIIYVNLCRMGSTVRQLIFGNHNILDTTMDAVKEDVILLVSSFTPTFVSYSIFDRCP